MLAAIATLMLFAAAPAEAAPGACDVTGRVLDASGRAVSGLRVQATPAGSAGVVATDDEGRFRLGTLEPASRVVVALAEHRGGKDRFVLYRDRAPIELSRAADGCTIDLDLREPAGWSSALPTEDWPAAFQIHQNLAQGLRLADELGIALGDTPLEVALWHAAASPDASFWVGTPSHLAKSPRTPLLGIGTAASRADAPGAPDNREYHELGHHVLAAAFGALPRARGDTPHGGYFRNPTSADAWSEGFATFFAMMVAARIEGRADPSRYRLDGARVDLELDYRPWDLGGLEELAVAGVLLDVVDDASDPGDPEPSPPAIEGVVHGDGLVVVELATVAGSTPARVVRLSLRDDADTELAAVRVDPSVWRIASTTAPRLPIVLPDGIDPGSVARAQWTAAGGEDDDRLAASLPELWRAISTHRSEQAESNGRLFDVADLHAALSQAIGKADADGNGRSDLDDVFVAHGLFADLDGDHELDDGETIGRTAHPERALSVDGEATTWPSMPARRSVPTPAGLRVAVTGQDAAARLYVETSWPSERGRDVELSAPEPTLGRVLVMPPPSGADARVHLVADADDHRPQTVATWTAEELHDAAAAHTTPTLSVEVALSGGEPGAGSTALGVRPLWLFFGGLASLAVGAVLLVAGALRSRHA